MATKAELVEVSKELRDAQARSEYLKVRLEETKEDAKFYMYARTVLAVVIGTAVGSLAVYGASVLGLYPAVLGGVVGIIVMVVTIASVSRA